METEKSIQNLTVEEQISVVDVTWKIRALLRDSFEITPETISDLSEVEREELEDQITYNLSILKGVKRDIFLRKVKHIISERNRNLTWNINHNEVRKTIDEYISRNKRIPSVTQVANNCSLTRQTVAKHMKSLNEDVISEKAQIYRILMENLIDKVYEIAVAGDLKAIKLFSELVEKKPQNTFNVNNQQINVFLKELVSKISSNNSQ